jgi:hypothetical protein
MFSASIFNPVVLAIRSLILFLSGTPFDGDGLCSARTKHGLLRSTDRFTGCENTAVAHNADIIINEPSRKVKQIMSMLLHYVLTCMTKNE